MVELANDGLRWSVKILDCRPFAQEFGIMAYSKVLPRFLARKFFQGRYDDVTHGSREDRAANDNHVSRKFLFERLANLFANSPDVFEIKITVYLTRCSHANDGH